MIRERSLAGGILIIIGVIFLGERLGWGLAWNIGRLWPLILVALGVVQLLDHRPGPAIWLLFLGGLFLLHQNYILRLHDSWPLFIVVAGIGMLFGRGRAHRSIGGPKPPADVPTGNTHD